MLEGTAVFAPNDPAGNQRPENESVSKDAVSENEATALSPVGIRGVRRRAHPTSTMTPCEGTPFRLRMNNW